MKENTKNQQKEYIRIYQNKKYKIIEINRSTEINL